jgi:tRNA(Ser,Leu) C12 N-acetylase TAN1
MDITKEDMMKRHAIAYPMEVGAPKFDLVPVEKEKDQMINIARLSAQQEYDRIMEVVAVLQKQADGIKRRLDITDMVYNAKYNFKIIPGKTYYLIFQKRKSIMILSPMGPNDWSSGPPVDYEYKAKVVCLGDYSWMEDTRS